MSTFTNTLYTTIKQKHSLTSTSVTHTQYTHTHTHIYIYIYIYIHTHTHTHTHIDAIFFIFFTHTTAQTTQTKLQPGHCGGRQVENNSPQITSDWITLVITNSTHIRHNVGSLGGNYRSVFKSRTFDKVYTTTKHTHAHTRARARAHTHTHTSTHARTLTLTHPSLSIHYHHVWFIIHIHTHRTWFRNSLVERAFIGNVHTEITVICVWANKTRNFFLFFFLLFNVCTQYAGFRPKRSTTEQIFNITLLIEKHLQHQRDL